MNFKDRLKELSKRGYRCDYPNASHRPLLADGKTAVEAVYLEREGQWPQMIFMAVEGGTVLCIDCLLDYSFDDFLNMLDRVKPAEPKPLPGQRSLFDED